MTASLFTGLLTGATLAITFLPPNLPAAAVPDPWATRVAQPPAAQRIVKIIHGWPDAAPAQDALIGRLQQQGFGGVVCNVSFQDYLESEVKWNAFTRAVQRAHEAGMALWLYDEKGYPSANAGGLVLRDHPEWQARGLLVAEADANGSLVTLELPPGELRLLAAFPVAQDRIELDKQRDLVPHLRDRKLSWQPSPGHWKVVAITETALYEGTHAELNLHEKMPYPNLLDAAPTKRFIELTHARYAQHLGTNLGRYFVATFTDEPSLMSLFLKPMPYRVLPWSTGLPSVFQGRRGYSLDPWLPALVLNTGPAGSKARHDFWLTIGELVAENFFGQIQTWCRAHGLPSGGHLLMEENFVAHIPLYGDFFGCARRLDAPSIDCLTSIPAEVPWYIARLLASAAELENQTVVMSESSDHGQRYRPRGDSRPPRTVTEAEIRGATHRLIVNGVNAITSYYSFAGLDDAALQRLNTHLGRACAAVFGGQQVSDVALVYPLESLWVRFVPSRFGTQDTPAATRLETICRTAAETLFAHRRDFTFIDSRTLREARVEPGALTHGRLRWPVVVLPGVDTLPLSAWENLERFVAQGGVLVALGHRPQNSEHEFPSPRVEQLAQRLFGPAIHGPAVRRHGSGGAAIFLPGGTESTLATILTELLPPDVAIDDPRAPVRVTHRRIEGREVFLLINDSSRSWQGTVRFRASGNGEHWDLTNGTLSRRCDPAKVAVNLEPYGATCFRFPEATAPKVKSPRSGSLPGLEVHPLPLGKPEVYGGEFVRASLTPDSAPEHSQAWRARATLTKSQVDTFLFTRFPLVTNLNFQNVEALVIDSWVPPGQKSAAQLLVIVRERGGGDFLAPTSRALSEAGWQQHHVSLSRLQLAGWSQDSNGELDLDRIADIRVGWGGYFGQANEQIEFTLAAPRASSKRK